MVSGPQSLLTPLHLGALCVALGVLKANPEDFVVVEDLGFEPDGEGEHILVRILKNGCNTRFVA
ncbi:hypothetical protein NLN78_23625, partial [Citrobacter portucalensis]|nr:hypothetical protein [Citrobacter portucalensis]